MASFLIYYGSPLCMLASCHPISDCVMSDYVGSFTSIIGLPVNSSAPSSSPPPFISDLIIDILSDIIQNTSDVHTTSTDHPTSTTTTTTTVATRVEDGALDNLDLDVMPTTTAPLVSEAGIAHTIDSSNLKLKLRINFKLSKRTLTLKSGIAVQQP